MTGAAVAALDELRRHPRHVLLASLVAGMLAAPLAPRLILLIALVAGVAAGRGGVAVAAGVAVLAGAIGGQARSAAVERSALGPLLGTTGEAVVTLLEQPRPVQYGSTALAELRGWRGEATGATAGIGAGAAAGAGTVAGTDAAEVEVTG